MIWDSLRRIDPMVPIATLQKLGFLEDFPPKYLEPLAAVAEVIDVPANEVLFREGEKSACIYIVIEGKVALEISAGSGVIRIQTVGPGKLLGWTPVLAPGPMTAQAVALEPCRLVAINAMQILQACAQNPSFGMQFMRRTAVALSRRLHATRQQILDSYEKALPVISE